VKWFVKCMRQYADFHGRARRTEYWMFSLVLLVIGAGSQALDWWLFGVPLNPFTVPAADTLVSVQIGWIGLLVTLVTLVPGVAVQVRRLHDIDRSGWWSLLVLVPVLGWIGLWGLSALAGDGHPNRFGPDPKRAVELV
jgi:uncharacterized membrane protein YhaH (DUF805 family)